MYILSGFVVIDNLSMFLAAGCRLKDLLNGMMMRYGTMSQLILFVFVVNFRKVF